MCTYYIHRSLPCQSQKSRWFDLTGKPSFQLWCSEAECTAFSLLSQAQEKARGVQMDTKRAKIQVICPLLTLAARKVMLFSIKLSTHDAVHYLIHAYH